MTLLTASSQKVGAHLEDTKALVAAWDSTLSAEDNVTRIIEQNLLGLPSQSRANDVMVRALRPRFIAPDAEILEAFGILIDQPAAFQDACFYEFTRVDGLAAAFCAEQLMAWWEQGRVAIETVDTKEWIDQLAADRRIADWTPNIRARVARGMMAALRDLGRLTGPRRSPKKEIVRPGISLAGFGYVGYRLHQQGESGRGILGSPTWRRWLLDENRVDELMHRLVSLGVVYYSVAGSTLRIDWRVGSLKEVARAAV